MKPTERNIVKAVLSKEIGWFYIPLLFKCIIRKKSIFKNCHWTNEQSPESEFVKRLSFASALYLELQKKMSTEKSFEIMRKILVSIGCKQQWEQFYTLKSDENPMAKLMAFNDLMDTEGTPQFNRREYLEQNDSICHFVITRCVFSDFFHEAGTPELTKLFCAVDQEFFPKAFPDFEFHRGGSWKNTIAYGKNHCDFIFQKRE